MKYGYFDENAREYVITRPDTPAPWANYLGSPAYGAIISNNAGGYSFVKSGANGRILRYRFDDSDQPGRYIYIRDNSDGDYWSASWQPVGKDLDCYQSECRHGLGYSVFSSDYRDIHSQALYYVPLDEEFEVWELSLTNNSGEERSLTVTAYAEFTNNSNYEQDQVNLQYSRFISRTVLRENRVVEQVHGNLDALPENEQVDEKNVEERFFALAGAPVSSACGDRDVFLGRYHTYANPAGVISGDLGKVTSYNEYPCGALSAVLSLAPEETKTIAFLLGRKYDPEVSGLLARYQDTAAACKKDLDLLKQDWEKKLSAFHVDTPDENFNAMINTWNAYNCYMTFIWSRAASFIYCGLRNGYGYRDTVQDIQGIIHLNPEMAADKIRFMLSAQVDNGGGLPLVKFTHNAGHEDTPDDPSYVKETGHPAYRADDALWLFPTVYKYLAETGNLAFLDEEILYANKGSDTVYDHLKNAIRFSGDHMGKHGMPAGLYADWNDCLRLGADGESTFVAFQYYYALQLMKKLAEYKKDEAYLPFLDAESKRILDVMNSLCWDGDRFIRGFPADGGVTRNWCQATG